MKKLILILMVWGCDYAPTEHTHEHEHDTTHEHDDIYGCTDSTSTNFDSTATIFDNTCDYPFVFINPSGGESLSKGLPFTITWVGGNINDTIRLSLVDVNAWTVELHIAQSIPNSGSYNWSVAVGGFGCGEKQIYIGDICIPFLLLISTADISFSKKPLEIASFDLLYDSIA